MAVMTARRPTQQAWDVRALLPHRPPVLLVDRILSVELEGPLRIVAAKAVRETEPCFQGHYPGRPLYPGLWILEGLAQTGLLLFQLSGRPVQPAEVPVLAATEGRFLRPVFPGAKLLYRVEIDKRTELAAVFHGQAEVDEMVVAKASFTFGVKPWLALNSL